MKLFSFGSKGIGALAVVWLTYINHTFSPLIWVLLALAAADLFLHVHKPGMQFSKIGAMAVSFGLPTVISNNLGSPELAKYIVAILCLAYLQVVIPALVEKLQTLQLSKDPKQNAADQATIDAILQKLEARETAAANQVWSSAKLASTGAVPAAAKEDSQGGA